MGLRGQYYINNHSYFKLDYHLVSVTKYRHNVSVLVNKTKKQLLIILKIRELKNKIKNNNIFKNNSIPTMQFLFHYINGVFLFLFHKQPEGNGFTLIRAIFHLSLF